ncbi:response regulator [Thalassotalea sp. M1531]|uniref:Sensor protein FixL n=1 Tax=Thalassotalea algicola TaxID=2716224 RepID=A0A7Y0LBX1_9GAMM|nr:ATP-binding protein [Thalassotalea algicola]NMP31287.1 response regulator [Thalassotalea algicola]
MTKSKTIQQSFIQWFLFISLIPVVFTAGIIYTVAKKDVESEIIDYLATEVAAQTIFIQNWFDYRFMDLKRLSSSEATTSTLATLQTAYKSSNQTLAGFVESVEWEELSSKNRQHFMNQWYLYDYIYDLFIIDNEGNVLFSVAKENELGTNLFHGQYANTKFALTVKASFQEGQTLFSDLERYQPSNSGIYGFVVTPILDDAGERAGVFAIQIKLDRINQLLETIKNEDGYNFLVAANGEYRSAIHDSEEQILRDKTPPIKKDEQVLLSVKHQNVTAYRTLDVDGHEVISVRHPLSIGGVDWFVINETHNVDAFAFLEDILISSLFVVIVTILVVSYVAYIASSRLTTPILNLTQVVKAAQKGNVIPQLRETSELELKELGSGLLNMIEVRKSQELSLKNHVDFQQAVLNNLGEALIIIDRQGIIRRFSTAAVTLFGYQEKELIGKNVKMLMPEHFAKHHDGYLKNYKGERKDNMIGKSRELLGLRKDGSAFLIELIVTSVFNQKEELFVGLVKDISERMQTQSALVKALENSDAANRAKGEFLANMSHEIRTPMNGVYGSLQVLKKQVKEASSVELIDKALFSCKSQLTIINDILDFSKVEAGMLTLEEVPFSFSELVHVVISEINPIAVPKGIEVQYQLDEGAHDSWIGDPVRVKQVLVNLVSNAVKFTQKGSVTIAIAKEGITDGQLIFTIQDTGIGMTSEQISRLFKRFEQADTSTTRKFGGTGLGMAITHALVSLMHGRIEVESTLDKGTNFEVSLPLTKADDSLSTVAEEFEVITPELSDKRILLAEDNRINQKVFLAMIKATNAEVEIVENGKQAVELVDEYRPDFVFMDIQMPEMDGMEACRLIKRKHRTLPIVALTANVMEQDIKKYQMLGFDDHVGKPIEIQALFRAITTHLK